MRKKIKWIWIIIILIILGVIGYLIFHKSPKPTATSNNQTNSSSFAVINNSVVRTNTAAGVGKYLTDLNGNALYTYSGDTKGVSNCLGSCVDAWPPYNANTSPATIPVNITIITRLDGSKQYAYKGLPLYTFSGDSNGKVTGNGEGGFSVARP